MKLSEAIRLGAMLKPQGVSIHYSRGRTCAMGAALDAIGKLDTSCCGENYGNIARAWPWVEKMRAISPVLHMEMFAWRIVEDLNDCHNWTREQIADWVQTIEPQDVPETAPEEAESAAAVARTQEAPQAVPAR